MNAIRATHIIESVEPKEGTKYNHYHDEVRGKPCYVLSLNVGEHGVLGVEFDYDPGHTHRFFTTIIRDIEDYGDVIVFETRNTVYTLRKRNHNEVEK